MIKWFLVLVCVSAVAARRSPNADYIDELESTRQGRYSSDILEDARLDVPGLLAKYGYPYEVHNVITEDGYILEMHRIPHGRDRNNRPNPNKPIVFLMHGLLSSSADFLVLGPGNALGYLLAEAGYDVWLGNARGNFYSRRHRRLNPDSIINQNFWKFSWDEIGYYDIAAFVDYILQRTKQSKLHYVGHSQGGTTFLVLNSLRPEYNKKFKSFQGLAPAAIFTNNDHLVFSALAPFENIIETTAFSMGIGEIFGNREFITWFATNFCHEGSIFHPLCGYAMTIVTASENFNQTMLPLFLGHAPAGASIRQVAHYGQCIRFNAFRRYNFNLLTNLAVYGRRTPPEYDLSKITVPAYIHYGLRDREVNYKDLHILAKKLGNTVGIFRIPRETFNHYDFIWSSKAKTEFYDFLIRKIREADRMH
nr:esterase [Manduca sexta]